MSFPSDDRYFRFTFGDSKRVAGLLREFLPTELTACLDLDKIKRIHENQVRDTLRESRDDLNLECPMIPTGKVLIRILVEHKSDHAPELWLQLMRSICADWEQNGFRPVIPVILHTGPEPFRFESPQNQFPNCPNRILDSFPILKIYPIDLSRISEELIWNSLVLDYVSKVGLSILRLAQQRALDLTHLRNMLRREWPGIGKARQNRYIVAAISYLRFKSEHARQILHGVDTNMPFVHSINPKSLFAEELREEFAKGQALNRIEIVQGMLAKGRDWDLIQEITHLDQAAFAALKQKYQA